MWRKNRLSNVNSNSGQSEQIMEDLWEPETDLYVKIRRNGIIVIYTWNEKKKSAPPSPMSKLQHVVNSIADSENAKILNQSESWFSVWSEGMEMISPGSRNRLSNQLPLLLMV